MWVLLGGKIVWGILRLTPLILHDSHSRGIPDCYQLAARPLLYKVLEAFALFRFVNPVRPGLVGLRRGFGRRFRGLIRIYNHTSIL